MRLRRIPHVDGMMMRTNRIAFALLALTMPASQTHSGAVESGIPEQKNISPAIPLCTCDQLPNERHQADFCRIWGQMLTPACVTAARELLSTYAQAYGYSGCREASCVWFHFTRVSDPGEDPVAELRATVLFPERPWSSLFNGGESPFGPTVALDPLTCRIRAFLSYETCRPCSPARCPVMITPPDRLRLPKEFAYEPGGWTVAVIVDHQGAVIAPVDFEERLREQGMTDEALIVEELARAAQATRFLRVDRDRQNAPLLVELWFQFDPESGGSVRIELLERCDDWRTTWASEGRNGVFDRWQRSKERSRD